MSEILKNGASPQAVYSPAIGLLADGTDVTSGVAAEVSKDGAAASAAAGTLAHVGHGVWSYLPTQGDVNADSANVTFYKTGAKTVSVALLTTGKRVGALNDAPAAPDIAPLAANIVKVKAAVLDSATVSGNTATLSNGTTVVMDSSGNRTTTEH
jgi:hypothetical protein